MRFSNLISTACLFLLWNNPAFSKDMIPTGKKLVRFVCQRYNSEKNNLMDEIIILDQLSTKTLPGNHSDPEITGEMMVDTHRNNIDGKVNGKLRYYDNVSLFDYTSDEERTVLELTKKEDFDQWLEALLKTQATKTDLGNIMDYSGTIDRSFGFTDIIFAQGDPRKPKPENQIKMDISLTHYNFPVAFFKSIGLGGWPYVCGTPIFVEEMIEK